jgi:hypothetical protein
MADDPNDKPLGVRSPEPGVEVAREAEDRRRVTEIAREIEELGRALDERDRLARSDAAKKAESISGVAEEASPRLGKFATIPAIPEQRKLMVEGGRLTKRGKRWFSLTAVIIVLSLASAGVSMLMGAWIENPQNAYRSAVAETPQLTARENAETEAAARKAHAEQRATEEQLATAVAAQRREEETRQAIEDKARADAARETAQARAAAQEAAKRQTADDASLKAVEPPRNAADGKPKSDSEVRAQAERAEIDLKLSEQDRKRVQVALDALGHNIPTATGYFGPRTRAMIKAWQKTQGLPETGYLAEAQLATLRQQAAAALAKYDRAQRPR